MKDRRPERFFLPDFLLFAGTRVALGLGAGLLLSRRMNNDQRKAAGLALVAVGGLTTIPLAMRFAHYRHWRRETEGQEGGRCACGCPHCCTAEPKAAPAA